MGMHAAVAYAARCDPVFRPHFRAIGNLFHHVQRRLDVELRNQPLDQQWRGERAEEWLQFAWRQFDALKEKIDRDRCSDPAAKELKPPTPTD